MVGWPMAAAVAVAALWMLLGGAAAQAHTRSQSHSVWEFNGPKVDVIMTIPEIEVGRLATGDAPAMDERVKDYLAKRVYPTQGGKACNLVPPIETLSAVAGFRKYDFTYTCPSAANLQIHFSAFFDLVPSHTNFAQVQNALTGEFTEQLLTTDHQSVDITGDRGSRLKSARFFEFIRMGILHILTGVDHMSFLLGLVLISRRLRDLLFVVTGFTIGHSLTLALAVTGVLRPHAEYIDALVALTIALIGAENLVVQTRRSTGIVIAVALGSILMAVSAALGWGGLPSLLVLGAGLFTCNYLMISGHLQDAGRLRMFITLIFGLIHGFGFAADLLELQLPTDRLAELLVGFNLGVEFGQISLVAAATLCVIVLRRTGLALPRPIVVDVASAFLVGLGVFWFVERSYA